MTYLLELVFNAMVMVVGLQELDSTSNIERLKQNMKVRSGRPEIFMRLYQDTLLFRTLLYTTFVYLSSSKLTIQDTSI